MDFIVNTLEEDFEIILFEYDNRKWEITIDKNLSDSQINLLVIKRIDELTDEFLDKQTYDESDLIVDYTTNKEG
jgi:predicted transcriptional regulator YheO